MHNKTVTRQSSSQRKSRHLSGKLHCLNFVFPAENETLGLVGLGRETSSSSSVSLSMLKVSIKEGTTSVNSNHVASNFMVICIRPSPLFFRLASNELPDIGSVSRIEKKNTN